MKKVSRWSGKIPSQQEFVSYVKSLQPSLDFSKTVYLNMATKVIVTCRDHGDFKITPAHLVRGSGCKSCAINNLNKSKVKGKSYYLNLFKELHKNKYYYSIPNDVRAKTLIQIYCPHHGDFKQTVTSHLNGSGCTLCGRKSRNRLTWPEILKDFRKTHGDRYKYLESTYTDTKHKISIICELHGAFYQTPINHRKGTGCPSCAKNGFKSGKDSYFYILSAGDRVKIGITNNNPEYRCSRISKSSGIYFNVSYKVKCSGELVKKVEHELLKYLKKSFRTPDEKFEGYTEVFLGVDADYVKILAEELFTRFS